MSESHLILLTKNPAAREALLREVDVLRNDFPQLKITSLDLTLVAGLPDKKAAGVVIDLDDWTPSDEMALLDLRGVGYNGPILILTKRPITIDVPGKGTADRVVVFVKPYVQKEMIGVVRRMILAPLIASRKHPRHETNETGEIRLEGVSGFVPCRIKNLSKGGAFLEVDRPLHLRIGDQLVVKIRLAAMGRAYSMKGRVAWLMPKGLGFGVEFTGSAPD